MYIVTDSSHQKTCSIRFPVLLKEVLGKVDPTSVNLLYMVNYLCLFAVVFSAQPYTVHCVIIKKESVRK